MQVLTQTFFIALGYTPDIAGPKFFSYKREIWILKTPYNLFGSPRLLHRDIHQERDFFDHKGEQG